MRTFRIGGEVMGGIQQEELRDPPLWCDVLGRGFTASDYLWLSGVVGNTVSISHGVSNGVSNKGLRSEL